MFSNLFVVKCVLMVFELKHVFQPPTQEIVLALHTSGTTRRPKLVPLSHGTLCSGALCIASTLKIQQEDDGWLECFVFPTMWVGMFWIIYMFRHQVLQVEIMFIHSCHRLLIRLY